MNMIKRIAVCLVLLLLFFSRTSDAKPVYVMTLNDVTSTDAHQGIREFMFSKNFALTEEQPHMLLFSKVFPYLGGNGRRFVRFNFLNRSEGTRVLVTGSVNQIGPIIKEIKHRLDSTPRSQIRNEAKDQLPGPVNRSPLTLGMAIREKNTQGYVLIDEVWEISWAEDVGLKAGDVILEVNGNSTAVHSPGWIQELLRGWYSMNTPFTLIIQRGNRKGIVRFSPVYPYRPVTLPNNNK